MYVGAFEAPHLNAISGESPLHRKLYRRSAADGVLAGEAGKLQRKAADRQKSKRTQSLGALLYGDMGDRRPQGSQEHATPKAADKAVVADLDDKSTGVCASPVVVVLMCYRHMHVCGLMSLAVPGAFCGAYIQGRCLSIVSRLQGSETC